MVGLTKFGLKGSLLGFKMLSLVFIICLLYILMNRFPDIDVMFLMSATKLNWSLCSEHVLHVIMQYWTASTLRYHKDSIFHWKRNSENRLTTSCFPKSKSASYSAYYRNKNAFLDLTELASCGGTYSYFLQWFCSHQHYLETISKTLAT